jgi:putative peptide zinc metalloprotease protein
MSYYESPSDFYGKNFGSGSPEVTHPRLRSDLIIRHQQYGPDENFIVVKDPISKQYYKLPPVQWDLFALFDGQHTEQDIIAEYNEKYPAGVINEEVIETTKHDLKTAGLLDVSSTERNLMLMERIRSERKVRLRSKDKWTFEYMILWSFDPDKLLDRMIPKIRFLWTKTFLVISLMAILGMLTINVIRWDEFWQGTLAIYSFRDKTFWDVLVFIFFMTMPLSIHEFGHALTMKRYGGECHQVGFMLFYLSPAFFADAADAYLLEKRSERIWFSLAGVYSEALLCCIATYVWFFTPPGTAVHDFAFLIFLFSGITGFLMNLNPLVRLDGYYILADLVGIDELREESLRFLTRWFKRTIFRLDAPEPPEITRRKRRIFFTYGVLSLLYTFSLYLVIFLWVKNIYIGLFGQLGYLLFLATLVYLFRKSLREGLGFLKVVWLDKREVLMNRIRFVWFSLIGLVLLLLIPSHMKIASPFVIEPSQRAEIRSQTDGFVDKLFVKERNNVKAGQVLAKLRNPDLGESFQRVTSALDILDRELAELASSGVSSDYQMKLRTRQQLVSEKAELEKQMQQLTLTSPITGTVLTPHLEEKIGTFQKKGSLVCVVADLAKVKVQIPVSEYGIEDVKVGQRAVLKLNAYPAETFEGQVEKISPAVMQRVEAVEGTFSRFDVRVVIDNKDGRLVPGMDGDAKILAARYPFVGRMLRELVRGVRSTIW